MSVFHILFRNSRIAGVLNVHFYDQTVNFKIQQVIEEVLIQQTLNFEQLGHFDLSRRFLDHWLALVPQPDESESDDQR